MERSFNRNRKYLTMNYISTIILVLLFVAFAVVDGYNLAKTQAENNKLTSELAKIEAKNKRLEKENYILDSLLNEAETKLFLLK